MHATNVSAFHLKNSLITHKGKMHFTYSVEVYMLDYLPISVFFQLFTYSVEVYVLDLHVLY